MLAAPSLAGRRYAVLGLARTGRSVLGFLERSGAQAIAWDSDPAAREAAALAFPQVEQRELLPDNIAGLDGLILSPGVPLNRHPLPLAAKAVGVPLLGDMELFQLARASLPPHKLVAITGTNGKSTATMLIHHLLGEAGIAARLGGNIGLPVLDQPALPDNGVYVLELSSYQLDLCHTLAADIAVWTNLTPDHLDRYDGINAYYEAKLRLLTMQPAGATAVIATDDSWTRAAARRIAPGVRLVAVSAADVDAADQARWPALAGPHNAQNVACAAAVARLLGVPDVLIEGGLRSFGGLPHRMETVATIAGVTYVNDSKATNPASTAPALRAWPAVRWILGGQAKAADLDACMPHLAGVRSAYVIGEASGLFADLLAPHCRVTRSGTLVQAVLDAARDAQPGEVVLLSPAAASFDQFRDFEHRGDAFRTAVQALGRKEAEE